MGEGWSLGRDGQQHALVGLEGTDVAQVEAQADVDRRETLPARGCGLVDLNPEHCQLVCVTHERVTSCRYCALFLFFYKIYRNRIYTTEGPWVTAADATHCKP